VKPVPGSWQHDLVELLQTLRRHDVPFLVVGGYAVAHAGHLRATKDLDVFVPRAAGVDVRLASALSEFVGATVRPEEAQSAFLRFFRGTPGRGRRDPRATGGHLGDRVEDPLDGSLLCVRMPFLGIDALIRNKRAVGRRLCPRRPIDFLGSDSIFWQRNRARGGS
jgi:hypothetical protein